MKSPFAVALVLLAGITAASPASAQSSSSAAAEVLFERGRELSQAGRHEEACEKYEASQALDPALGTLLYLGDCYERIGKLASAWAVFREAASLARTSGQRQRQETADARSTALEPRLSRVAIGVPEASAVDGLEVRLSGLVVPRASWGVALPVDPGDHRIDARAPGRHPWVANLRMEGDGAREDIEIPVLAVAPAREGTTVLDQPVSEHAGSGRPSPKASPDHAQRIAGITVSAVGVASVAAGAILGARALARNDDSLDECRTDDPNLCTPLGVELRDEAQDYALGSTIAFISGGGLIAAGVAIYFTAGLGDGASQRMGRFTPLVVAQHGAGILWGGMW